MTPKRRLAGLKAENSKRSKSRRTQRARRYLRILGTTIFRKRGAQAYPGACSGALRKATPRNTQRTRRTRRLSLYMASTRGPWQEVSATGAELRRADAGGGRDGPL